MIPVPAETLCRHWRGGQGVDFFGMSNAKGCHERCSHAGMPFVPIYRSDAA
jgi:hypothetical protein